MKRSLPIRTAGIALLGLSSAATWLWAGGASKIELRSSDSELAKLSWMTGNWASKSGTRNSEEHWTHAEAGTMFGVSRTISGGKTVDFEFLRIVSTPEGITYLSAPQGRNPPTPFKAVKFEDRRVVFENLEHDFPQRIIYWRDADNTMHARIEGTKGGKERGSDWRWQPAVIIGE